MVEKRSAGDNFNKRSPIFNIKSNLLCNKQRADCKAIRPRDLSNCTGQGEAVHL